MGNLSIKGMADEMEAAFKKNIENLGLPSPPEDTFRAALFSAISEGVLNYLSKNPTGIQTNEFTYAYLGKHSHSEVKFSVIK